MALTVHSQSALNGRMGGIDVTTADLVRLLGSWQRRGPGYAALATALRALILDGRVPIRARLPSERSLAEALSVSRTTTTAAYDLLRGEGYVESRQGSGSRVTLPTGGTSDRELPTTQAAPSDAIDMTIAALPAPGAMMEAVERATADLAGHLGGIGYDPTGLPSLRRTVGERFTRRGVPTTPEQIVITAGAQHALALLLDVLTAAGDPVLVETPSYPNAFAAMRRAGVRTIAAPMTAAGWDMTTLAKRFRVTDPRLAYLIPDFQNPTGFLMNDDERAAIVEAARRAGSHLVVDETFVELDLEPWRRRPKPVAAHDRTGVVVTTGSMSKAYWGGLRVGWIRATVPLAHRVARARVGIDLSTPVLEQLVAQHLLEGGEEAMAERRALVTSRRDALMAAVRSELPAWRFAPPRGGLSLWVELDGVDASALAPAAEEEGVRIIPGSTFAVDGALDDRLRLPYTQPEDVLEEAVRRLATAERHAAEAVTPAVAGTPGSAARTAS